MHRASIQNRNQSKLQWQGYSPAFVMAFIFALMGASAWGSEIPVGRFGEATGIQIFFVLLGIGFVSAGFGVWSACEAWGKTKAAWLGTVPILALGLLGLWPWVRQMGFPAPHDFDSRKAEVLVVLSAALVVLSLFIFFVAGRMKYRNPRPIEFAAYFLGFYLFMIPLWSIVPITGDEPHYLLMSQSLIQDQDLDLSNNYADRDWANYYQRGELHPQKFPTNPGILAPGHSPALALLLAPGLVWGGLTGAFAIVAILGAALAGLVYDQTLKLGGNGKTSAWMCGGLFLGFPFGIQVLQFFPDILGAVCLLLIWNGVGQAANRSSNTGVNISQPVFCIALAVLPWLQVRMFYYQVFLGLLLAIFLYKTNRRQTLAWATAAVILSLSLLAWYHMSYYGKPWPWAAYGPTTPDDLARSVSVRVISTHTLETLKSFVADPMVGWVLNATPLVLWPWAIWNQRSFPNRNLTWIMAGAALIYLLLLGGTPVKNSLLRYQISAWALLTPICVSSISLLRGRFALLKWSVMIPVVWGVLVWLVPWFRYPPRYGPPWVFKILEEGGWPIANRIFPVLARGDLSDHWMTWVWLFAVLAINGLLLLRAGGGSKGVENLNKGKLVKP